MIDGKYDGQYDSHDGNCLVCGRMLNKENECSLCDSIEAPLLKRIKELEQQVAQANSASAELLKRRDLALSALKLAYSKHVMGNDSIGWSELEDKISDCIASITDPDEYSEWEVALEHWEKHGRWRNE